MSVEAKILQIIPAAPGWHVVRFELINTNEIHVAMTPVVCFALVERRHEDGPERTVEPLAPVEFGDGSLYAAREHPVLAPPGAVPEEFYEMAVERACEIQKRRADGKAMFVQQGDTMRRIPAPDRPRSSRPPAD